MSKLFSSGSSMSPDEMIETIRESEKFDDPNQEITIRKVICIKNFKPFSNMKKNDKTQEHDEELEIQVGDLIDIFVDEGENLYGMNVRTKKEGFVKSSKVRDYKSGRIQFSKPISIPRQVMSRKIEQNENINDDDDDGEFEEIKL